MINFIDTNFYDNASKNYSENRYNLVSISYIQFFFKKRLSIVINQVQKIISKNNLNNISLLESGCADGVVINKIIDQFSSKIDLCIGTDISPGMIEQAVKQNRFNKVRYFLKGREDNNIKYDIVLAIGYMSPGIFDQEFDYLLKNLKKDRYIIISLASKNSLYTKLKLKDKNYVKDYWSHGDYYKYLLNRFDIISISTCGLFIPKLWAFPALARIAQPIIENLFSKFLPKVFHEQIFVLKLKK